MSNTITAAGGSNPRHGGRKILIWIIFVAVLLAAGFIYVRFYFVFGEGVKTGQLNRMVYKGYVFKTHEGILIQAGYSSSAGIIQSNEFEFSVVDSEVSEQLELKSGRILDLHYKEYLGRLPWRGQSKFVVDRIIGDHQPSNEQASPVTLPQ